MEPPIAEKVDAFFTQFRQQLYKKKQILLRADDTPSGIFYIKKGLVKQYTISVKGDELVVNMFKPGAFFPMPWALNDTPNKYFFEAVEDTEVWKAPKDDVITFVKTNPDVLFNLLQRVFRGTDGLLDRLVYLMGGNAHTRLLIELIILAKRFGKGSTTHIVLALSETDLAAQTGMSRETISREIKVLKEQNLVTYTKGSLIIPDMQLLTQAVSDAI